MTTFIVATAWSVDVRQSYQNALDMFMAIQSLAKTLRRRFPQSLDGAPLLISSEINLVRPRLLNWLDSLRVYPRIVGEFDDSALMKTFGQAGAGVFIVPTTIAAEVVKQFRVAKVGDTEDVREQYYAISVERRISHSAVATITQTASAWLKS